MTAAAATHKSLKELGPGERAELILHQLDKLPTLPVVAARLLTVTTSDDACARDVVEIIESDAALTAAVLRMVRRANVGLPGETLTVLRAVTMLGFSTVRNAVLALRLHDVFARDEDGASAVEIRREFWRHNLAVACVAEAVGERLGGRQLAGEAFVCGLMHDIGKIALETCLPKSYARALDRVKNRGVCICDAEREVFGFDHTVAGRRLTARWRLDPAISECAWLHHQAPEGLPSSVRFGRLVRIVHLADTVVRRERIGFSGYSHISDVATLARELSLKEGDMAAVLDGLPARMNPFSELIGLDEPYVDTDPKASLLRANEQLGQLNAKLTQSNRRLEVRSACLAALETFARRLAAEDGVQEVCLAAAHAIRAMLDADCAVTFLAEPHTRCVHAAYAQRLENGEGSAFFDLGTTRDDGAPHNLPMIPSLRGFSPAPEGCDHIWMRATGSPRSGPLWVLPLFSGPIVIGAGIVATREAAIRRFGNAEDACDTLSASIGSALAGAQTRLELERTAEELVDLNRRVQVAQREVVHAKSISMIAAMAAGAAHELNNPLSIVSGRAQMELSRTKDQETARALQIIIEHTQRASQLVSDLMRFAKPETPKPTLLRLAEVLEPLCQHWQGDATQPSVRFTLSLGDPETTIYADPDQLHESLGALFQNAVEAIGGSSGHVHINSPLPASDETVRIVVGDNGAGMDPETLEHAFDPFFSSRPAGRGCGLGLSRAYRFAEINGGRLSIESKPGTGTTVTLELPARQPTT